MSKLLSSKKEGNIVRVSLECSTITTSNAADFEKELEESSLPEGGRLIIDMDKLEYISSSGLRAFLKLARSRKDRILLINVSDTVWDVFTTTGFSTFFDVSRRLKEYSTEGLTLVGQGGTGVIYRLDEERIIKVFYEHCPLESVIDEQESARRAVLAGLPTNIAFELARVGNCYAAVYEMLDGVTLMEYLKANPDRETEIIRQYTELLKTVHRVTYDMSGVASIKEVFIRKLEKGLASGKCSQDEYECMLAMLNKLPDGKVFIHGDLHFKNVMVRGGEMLMIDLPDAGCGHPFMDIFSLCNDYKLPNEPMFLEMLPPEMIEMILGFKPEKCIEIWNAIVSEYYDGRSDAELALLEKLATSYGYLRNAINAMVIEQIATPELRAKMNERVVSDFNGYIKDLNLEEIL